MNCQDEKCLCDEYNVEPKDYVFSEVITIDQTLKVPFLGQSIGITKEECFSKQDEEESIQEKSKDKFFKYLEVLEEKMKERIPKKKQ